MDQLTLKKIRIATRGSALALWQANFVAGLLKEHGLDSETLIIKTRGDRVQDRYLHEIGGKGLFVKELEQALLDGDADIAVHSLKDMPAKIARPFHLGAVLKRHAPADVMIFRPDQAKKLKLPEDTLKAEHLRAFGVIKVGTASLRCQALLQEAAPKIECAGVRGNVDTRIEKLMAGNFDALILAEAALERLRIAGLIYRRLDPAWFVPCAAQGALAVETTRDHELADWLSKLSCAETNLSVTIERAVLAGLGGDCTMPFGCHVTREEDDDGRWFIVARAKVLNTAGEAAHALCRAPLAGRFNIASFVDLVLKELAESGAGRILSDLGLNVPAVFDPR